MQITFKRPWKPGHLSVVDSVFQSPAGPAPCPTHPTTASRSKQQRPTSSAPSRAPQKAATAELFRTEPAQQPLQICGGLGSGAAAMAPLNKHKSSQLGAAMMAHVTTHVSDFLPFGSSSAGTWLALYRAAQIIPPIGQARAGQLRWSQRRYVYVRTAQQNLRFAHISP